MAKKDDLETKAKNPKRTKIKYYVRDGIPMKEERQILVTPDGRDGITIAHSNPFNPATDTPIETEAEFEAALAAHKAKGKEAIEQAIAQINARKAEIMNEKEVIIGKLMTGQTLTEAEAELMVHGYTHGGG